MTEDERLQALLSAIPANMEVKIRHQLSTGTDDERAAVRARLLRRFDDMDERSRSAMLERGTAVRQIQSRAPDVGTPAPGFSLKRLDSDTRVRLAELRGQPVGLIFGSYT